MKAKLISFVIPAKNEEESIKPLYDGIISEINKIDFDYEIIFIDDGSTDNTFVVMKKLHESDKRVKVIKLRGWCGKTVALQTGFDDTKGEIIFTMDADLQDNPKDIPTFLKKLDEGYDLVVGWKKKRYDSLNVVVPSRILNNFLIPVLTGVRLHDNNCGFKAFRREVVNNINLYGELFRFLPVLVAKQNFKVTEVGVHHRERIHGKSKYGWQKNVKGLLDLLTIVFLTGYVKRPGHFFGTFGLISFSFGFLIGLYITYLRVTTGSIQYRHPLLFLGMLLMIIGVQLVTTGLIAEMIVSFSQKRNTYENYIQNKLI